MTVGASAISIGINRSGAPPIAFVVPCRPAAGRRLPALLLSAQVRRHTASIDLGRQAGKGWPLADGRAGLRRAVCRRLSWHLSWLYSMTGQRCQVRGVANASQAHKPDGPRATRALGWLHVMRFWPGESFATSGPIRKVAPGAGQCIRSPAVFSCGTLTKSTVPSQWPGKTGGWRSRLGRAIWA